MKAINPSLSKHGDDDYVNRLLSYLQSQFFEKIIQFVPIRHEVFFLKTEKNTYILKGFQSNKRLRLQEAFTATLRNEGFTKTYLFLTPDVKEELFFDGTYLGCIEYISPNKSQFSFQTQKQRQEGIILLEQFHNTSAKFEARYRSILPKGDLHEKWKQRFDIFVNNIPFLKYFMNEPFISEIVSWANWSLEGMENNQSFFQNEPVVILHGDVAHHNFLRDKKGILHLIDFDLIHIGPASLDFLQYSNRILPYIDWSFDKLARCKPIQKYLHDDAYKYALAYPADIFREWNRMIREKSYHDHVKLKQVMDLSIGQFYTRKKFIDELKIKLK